MTKIGSNTYYHVSSGAHAFGQAGDYCSSVSPELIVAPMKTRGELDAIIDMANTAGSNIILRKMI